MIDSPPEFAHQLRRLENVSIIGFYDVRGADPVSEQTYELPIENLYFSVTQISDATLKRIAEFPKLRRIRFDQNLQSSQLAILESFPESISVYLPSKKD